MRRRIALPPGRSRLAYGTPAAGPTRANSPAAERGLRPAARRATIAGRTSPRRTPHPGQRTTAMRLHRLLLTLLAVAALVGIAYVGQSTEPAGSKMATAAQNFLDTLKEDQ